MSQKKHKIEVATPEDVKHYAGQTPQADGGAEAAAVEAENLPAPAVEGTGAVATEVEQWKDKFLRARAELANYQRRAEKEQADAIRFANAQLARSLLPVVDNLERAIESAEQAPDNSAALLEGAKLTLGVFLKTLKESNVERIEAEGRPFDPQVHEAMIEQPSPEHSERTVLKEILKGYRLYDRVLRPARVIVSKPAETPGGPNQADEDMAGKQ
ncbi:MAG TPA: nucleotide exchange factor GrpE [Phycisphaerae bacterium]|nr:nucleotide exchange factor GrpE [Phycisphaerae bacterium]